MKAKFLKKIPAWSDRFGKRHPAMLTYEYRGREYDVYDYGWDGGDSLVDQHRNCQATIDSQIEIDEKSKGFTPSTTAEEDFDYFWNYVNS